MLQTTIIAITFLVMLSMLMLISAIVVVTGVLKDKYAQGILINSSVNLVQSVARLIMAIPSALVQWAASNIASALLLVLCVYIHTELDYNEGKLLTHAQDIYYDVHEVWHYGIIVPVFSILGALWATFVPLFNWIAYVPISAIWGTLQVLGECGDPTVILKSVGQVFMAFGDLMGSFVDMFSSSGDGTSWMVNSLNITAPLHTIQTKSIQPMVDQMECLCEVFAPTINLVLDWFMDINLALAINAIVNIPVRLIQMPAQLASSTYAFNSTPVFHEIRDACYYTGYMVDLGMESALNWMQLQTSLGSRLVIPKPSLGTAMMRQTAVFWSIVEVPLAIMGALLAADNTAQSTFHASNFKQVFTQAHMGVLELASGVNTVQHLVTGHGTGTIQTLTCDFYGYDFFKDYNVFGSLAQECLCTATSCGKGICSGNRRSCECSANYVNAVPSDPLSVCVESCQVRQKAHLAQEEQKELNPSGPSADYPDGFTCNPFHERTPFSNVKPVGVNACQTNGHCLCPSGYMLDMLSGTCFLPGNLDKARWAYNVNATGCPAIDALVAQVGPPLPCAVQSAGLAAVGLGYTLMHALREMSNEGSTGILPWKSMQTADGMWYPRMDSVDCNYRKQDKVHDQTIDPENCQCEIDPDDRAQGRHFNPWCRQPTLNANVYSHMDALAFYAGKMLPFTIFGIPLPTGGMGWYDSFLNDNVGVLATNLARTAVESFRIGTRVASGAVSYALSIVDEVEHGTPNLLQMPMNCEWGSAYDGSTATKYFTATAPPSTAELEQVQTDYYKPTKAGCKDDCPAAIASWELVYPECKKTCNHAKHQIVEAMNSMYSAYRQYMRKTEISRFGCKTRAYTYNQPECGYTNADASCMCSIKLPYNVTSDKCTAIAYYPALDVESEDLHGYFNNPNMSHFYHQNMPWCNSMLLEWQYYRLLEASVAINNILARLDSSDPTAYEFDSPCYGKPGEADFYLLGDTTSVVKLFQRDETDNFYKTLVGQAPPGMENNSICSTLQGLGEPQWIYFENAGGGKCHGCTKFNGVEKTGFAHYLDPQPKLEARMDSYFGARRRRRTKARPLPDINPNNLTMPKPITYDLGGAPNAALVTAWQAFAVASGVTAAVPAGGTVMQLTQEAYLQNPETCANTRVDDNMIFQPCMHECRTTFGYDRCWCNVTVATDFICNVGELLRKIEWAAVSEIRRASTAIISTMGLIPGGMVYNMPSGLCGMSRVIGAACGAIASLLTGQQRGPSWTAARQRLAALMFAAADTFLVMPMGFMGKEARDAMTETTLAGASEFNQYQTLFHDIMTNKDGEVAAARDTLAIVLGNAVATKLWHGFKFQCIGWCNAMNGLQKVIFASDLTGNSAAKIIPTIEDFIDLVIQLLDQTFSHIIVLIAQVFAGFWGMLLHGVPSFGTWIEQCIDVVIQAAQMILQYPMQFFTAMLAILPEDIQGIAKLLMKGMCILTQAPAAGIIDALNGLGSLFDISLANPFNANLEQCIHGLKWTSTGGLQADDVTGNRGYDRRLKEIENNTYAERYQLLRDELDWNGTTLCARYGRHDVAPENEDLWDHCVQNRHAVATLREVLDRDYIPWTFMDDWKQPVMWAIKVAHGIVIYITTDESRLRDWEQVGYPVQASIDVMNGVRSLALPEWGTIKSSVLGMIPTWYPDYSYDTNSPGYHAYKIIEAAEKKNFPDLTNLNWGEFNEEVYNTATLIANNINFPSIPISDSNSTGGTGDAGDAGDAAPAGTGGAGGRRRLKERLTGPVGSDACPAGDKVCVNCRILQVFVNDVINISIATADFYKNKYVEQLQYTINVVSQFQATTRTSNAAWLQFGNKGQKLPMPPAFDTTFMDQGKPQRTLSTSTAANRLVQHTSFKDAAIAFVQTRGDEEVPYFGHSLWYYLQYPLRPCDAVEMAYDNCKTPSYSISDALSLTLHLLLIMAGISWLTGLPIPWTIRVPVLGVSFLIFRYDWVPRCLPVMPVCLMMDIQYLFDDFLAPCLCQVFPALVANPEQCTPGDCPYADNNVRFNNCPRTELGIFNPIVFYIRWQTPVVFQLMFGHDRSPLSGLRELSPTIQSYADSVAKGLDPSELEITCGKLGVFDVILVVIAAHILATALVPALMDAVQAAISAIGSMVIAGEQLSMLEVRLLEHEGAEQTRDDKAAKLAALAEDH